MDFILTTMIPTVKSRPSYRPLFTAKGTCNSRQNHHHRLRRSCGQNDITAGRKFEWFSLSFLSSSDDVYVSPWFLRSGDHKWKRIISFLVRLILSPPIAASNETDYLHDGIHEGHGLHSPLLPPLKYIDGYTGKVPQRREYQCDELIWTEPRERKTET